MMSTITIDETMTAIAMTTFTSRLTHVDVHGWYSRAVSFEIALNAWKFRLFMEPTRFVTMTSLKWLSCAKVKAFTRSQLY